LKRRFIYEIKRPKKDKKLPVVLSQGEVSQILSSINNIKHRAILMLIYSAGLRVSEVVNLKPEDIDAERGLIHIKGAKGRKDRYTILSDTTMETLGLYMNATEIYTHVSNKDLSKIKSPLDSILSREVVDEEG
jgi:site-specific recombinase XerD